MNLDTLLTYNPNILAAAERITSSPGIKRGSDYLFHAKKLLISSQLEYHFNETIETEEISGVSFDILEASISLYGTEIKQHYYTTKIKDYVIIVILSWSNSQEKDELDHILQTLSFSN
jgi:hypothetical protein